MPFFKLEDMPPIVLKMFDEDENNKNEFIGSSIVDFEEGLRLNWIKLNDTSLPTPAWIPLRYSTYFLIFLINYFLFSY